jgi:hypothetical protein
MEQGAGSMEQGAGSMEQGAWSGEQRAGSVESNGGTTAGDLAGWASLVFNAEGSAAERNR